MKLPYFTFIDLFAGLGGFHAAASSLGGDCVFASELAGGLRKLYEANFGVYPAGDIREVDVKDVPLHDALFAGFPCQPFSKAGAQQGRRDRSRGRLIDNVFDLVEHRSPRLVLLENVPNITKQRKGKYQNEIAKRFVSLGYCVDSIELSPHQFGVPQIRKRVYFIASKNSFDVKLLKPTGEAPSTNVRDVLDRKPADAKLLSPSHEAAICLWEEILDVFRAACGQIPSHPLWAMEAGATYPIKNGALVEQKLAGIRETKGSFGIGIDCTRRSQLQECVPPYALNDDFPDWKQNFILRNRESFKVLNATNRRVLKKLKKYPNSLQKLEWNCKGDVSPIWDHVIQLRPSGIRVRRTNAFSSLVAMTTSQVPIVGWEKRYLTTIEMARLQSLDSLKYLPSGNQAHKAFGNAVNVTVIRHILKHMLETSLA